MKSQLFKELQRRLKVIKKNLMPKNNFFGDYTAMQIDKFYGFRLLAHAELETYFEQRAIEILGSAKNMFLNGKNNKVINSLLAYIDTNAFEINKCVTSNNRASKIKDINTIVSETITKYYNEIISKNNGIKKINILKILLPIGVLETQLDSTWLSTIDSYGTKRGDVAHNSIKHNKVGTIINPIDEENTINIILTGIDDIEKNIFNKLL